MISPRHHTQRPDDERRRTGAALRVLRPSPEKHIDMELFNAGRG